MNLREAIGEYVVGYLQCHEVIGMDGDGVERIRRQAGEAEERLYRIVKVAEAAMAYMEHQAASVGDPVADEAAYYRERRRLWDAFMLAKDKAKEGGIVNLREAVAEYAVHYGLRQEVLGWEGEGVERIRRQFGEVEERLCRIMSVAETAMAIVEQQEAVDNYAFADAVMGRGELWEQYRAARAKAKAANQS